MKRVTFAFLCLLFAAAPAVAQDCRAGLEAAKALAGKAAPEAARKALRDAVGCFHRLATAHMQANDLAAAEKIVEEARGHIVALLGADDLAMAGNRQLYAVILLRRHNDRDGARDAFAQAARIRNAKVDAWDDSEGPMGAVGHKPSGLRLPPRAGELVQFRRDINNDDGTDVSLGYRGTGRAGSVSVTLYVYRPEGEFRAIFDQEKQGVRSFNPNAVLRREAPHALDTKTGRIEGRFAQFEYMAQGGAIGTRLYLFPLKREHVKLRVTFRLGDADFVDAQVAALLAAVGWPGN